MEETDQGLMIRAQIERQAGERASLHRSRVGGEEQQWMERVRGTRWNLGSARLSATPEAEVRSVTGFGGTTRL
jgi:hypothetical protein